MKSFPSQYPTRLDGKNDTENLKPRTPLPDIEKRAPLGSKEGGVWIDWEENTPESENERRDEEGGFGKRVGRVDKIGSRLGGFL
jgi:hypothetical protein